jgi:hypothetical protein
MSKVNAVPAGLHTITPQLSLEGAAEAIDFYRKAFGAEEIMRAPDPSGKKIWHAQIRIGSSNLFVNDTFPEMGAGATKSQLWIYVDGVDAAFKGDGRRLYGEDAAGRHVLGRPARLCRGQVGQRVEHRPAHEGPDAGRDEEGGGRLRRADEEVTRPSELRGETRSPRSPT